MIDKTGVGWSVGRGIVIGAGLATLLVVGAVAQPPQQPDRPAHAWCNQSTLDGTMALNLQVLERTNRQLQLNPGQPVDATAIRASLLAQC